MISYFIDDRINFVILDDDISNFECVDIMVNKIKEKYVTHITQRNKFFDSYSIYSNINEKYNICVTHNDIAGLIICAVDKRSNGIVTEIAHYLDHYLDKEVFNKRV